MATVMLVYLRNTKTHVSDSGHHQTQRPLKAAAVGCQTVSFSFTGFVFSQSKSVAFKCSASGYAVL